MVKWDLRYKKLRSEETLRHRPMDIDMGRTEIFPAEICIYDQ